MAICDLDDVVDKLSNIERVLKEMSTTLDKMSKQLDSIDSNTGFLTT